MVTEKMDAFTPDYSRTYSEFGGFSYIEIISKLHVFEVVSQVNSAELEIIDILANHHFSVIGKSFSEEEYLDYIEHELLGMFVGEKCKKFIHALDENNLLKQIEFTLGVSVQDALKDWRETRNVFAHGQFMIIPKKAPQVYFKGKFYIIENQVSIFLGIQEVVIEILKLCKSLYSPYYGKLVLKDSI